MALRRRFVCFALTLTLALPACNRSTSSPVDARRFLDNYDSIGQKLLTVAGTRALREYFQPLTDYLQKENAGRKAGW